LTTRRLAPLLLSTLLIVPIAGAALADGASRPAAADQARTAPTPAAALPQAAALATAPAAPSLIAPGAAGLIISIDPETGLFVPATAEQRLQLMPKEENMLSRSSVGLVEIALPGGGVMIDLADRFQDFSFASVGPSGRLVYGCATDPLWLSRALTMPPATPAVLEER
jgi:hypothetical protein